MCVHRRESGELNISPRWPKSLRFIYLQLKAKKDVEDSSLGLQRGGKQFSGRCKSKSLANKCLLGQAEKMGHRKEF